MQFYYIEFGFHSIVCFTVDHVGGINDAVTMENIAPYTSWQCCLKLN
jgi:hypothetical protein